MPIYVYRCKQGHETELLRTFEVNDVLCPCGSHALRQPINRLVVIGRAIVPRDQRNYRKSYGEYREAVAEVSDHYSRVNNGRGPGEKVQPPDYYGLAKAQAVAKGVAIR